MDKNFIYGIGAVKCDDKVVGYIEKDSFEFGGTAPEVTEINAEQVPGAPVLVIPQANGKIAPTFNMIQLDFGTLKQFLGGTLVGSEGSYTGWNAPRSAIVIEGKWAIETVSGQSILIPKAMMTANLDGKLALTETAKIAVTLNVEQPDSGAPYGVFETGKEPSTWSSDGTLPLE